MRRPGLFAITIVCIVSVLAIAWSSPSSQAQEATPAATRPAPVVISSEVLGRATPASVENPELALGRVTIMPGAAIPSHYHPGTQIGVVVQGTLTYSVFTGEVSLYRANATDSAPELVRAGDTVQVGIGDALVESPGSIHQGRNDGVVPVIIYLSTLFPAGIPGLSSPSLPLLIDRSAPNLTAAFPIVDSVSEIEAPAQLDDPFGIYIHIPFCSHICPYCDFNTYAGKADRIPGYVDAIKREIAAWAPRFDSRRAGSIFLGGGTPSLLAPAQIRSIVATCRETFCVVDDAEITIETNPNDLSVEYLAALLEAGVNRVSIGAQTLDRRGLRVLGRRHEASQTASAVAAARQAGYSNISLDFIFGWPGQTLAGWRDELLQVLDGQVGGTAPDHLSLYNLIVEPGTPMADAVRRGIMVMPDDDCAADLYETAIEVLASAGWTHYEIANWAASPALYSRHNATYWRNGDYVGAGAGAHGHVAATRTMNHPSPERYVELVLANESPVSNVEVLEPQTAMGETMMLGLRLLRGGVSDAAFQSRHGIAYTDHFRQPLARLTSLGLLESRDGHLRLAPRGVLLANSVSAEFLAS